MENDKIKIGTDATIFGPFGRGMKTIKKLEEIGYDSVWFADHLMNWIPTAIWTPDIFKIAGLVENPHQLYDVFSMMSIAGWQTNKIKIACGVIDPYKRNPALIAQVMLSQDHISRGRAILGISTGGGENIIPYGIKMEKPVSRLEEALKIIKLLWESEDNVNFDGQFWKLKDAVLGLKPYKKNKYPPIWIASHGPKMLELTGKYADGWLPSNLDPNTYKEMLNIITNSMKKAGRDPNEFSPGLWANVIVDEDHEECHKLCNSIIAKNIALIMDNKVFEKYGVAHPLGKDFYGMVDYVPSKYDRDTILDAIEKVPQQLCRDHILHGSAEEIIQKIETFMENGLKHIIFYNISAIADYNKMKSSNVGLKKVINYFKDTN
ncbi:MAG: LLM class flavin-dependent oxidoreductase [Promethearchaeota archaeon]